MDRRWTEDAETGTRLGVTNRPLNPFGKILKLKKNLLSIHYFIL